MRGMHHFAPVVQSHIDYAARQISGIFCDFRMAATYALDHYVRPNLTINFAALRERTRRYMNRVSSFSSPVLTKELLITIDKPNGARSEAQREMKNKNTAKPVPAPKAATAAKGGKPSGGGGKGKTGGLLKTGLQLAMKASHGSNADTGADDEDSGTTAIAYYSACPSPPSIMGSSWDNPDRRAGLIA